MWDYPDGPSFRLASRDESDRLSAQYPGGVLKQVFYAPSPATATAQYYALKGLGPYVPGAGVSEAGYTADQLQAQIRDYPQDGTLAAQAASVAQASGRAPEPTPQPTPEPAPAPARIAPTPVRREIRYEPPATPAPAPAEAEPAAAEPDPIIPFQDAPLELHRDPRDLWPENTDEEEVPAPRLPRQAIKAPKPQKKTRRKKANPVLRLLLALVLLILLLAVAVAVTIVTGLVDGPVLLQQVRQLPYIGPYIPAWD